MNHTIYIHGIGAHPAKKEWKQQWDLALFGKPMHGSTSMAYWSDILHGEVPPGAAGARALRLKAEIDPQDTAELNIDKLVAELNVPAKQRQKITKTIKKLAASIAKSDEVTASGDGKSKGTKALPLPGFLRRPIAKAFLERFVKDVFAYFYQPGAREQIQQRLRDEIDAQASPFVLVAHSLGTVIAFEVLSERRPRQDCSLFVTLGSPLGIDEVQDMIIERDGKLQVPENILAWHNFADRIDPVAADAGLSNDFTSLRSPGKPAVQILDQRIVNDRTLSLREFNPHSSLGYLSHRSVRSSVYHELRFDANGRFLVARDVAEEFVRPDRRVPVLIEALEPGYGAVDEDPEDQQHRESQLEAKQQTLAGRVEYLRNEITKVVRQHRLVSRQPRKDSKQPDEDAEIIALRKYVAARLTPDEINTISERHRELNIYAVWRNSAKRKVLERSHGPIKADAGRASFAASGRGILWAVLDTGVNWEHPHFKQHSNIAEVWDCTTGADQPEQLFGPGMKKTSAAQNCDLDGHGTHVSGIIAGGLMLENRRVEGIAPEAKLIIYKVLDDQGNGSDAWIIKAIDHIFWKNQSVTSGIKVHGVNLSLGGPFDPTVYGCGFSPICQELRGLWQQGTLVCVAAGNEGQIRVQTAGGDVDVYTQLSIGDPANLETSIAVGAVNPDKPHLYGVSYFSSRGPTADGRAKPDCVAPGERILSCDAQLPLDNSKQPPAIKDLYRRESGTSMACPHVSGLLAAFLSVRREFIGRPDDVKRILLDNCNDLGRDRYHQGAGMPNLMKMLTNT